MSRLGVAIALCFCLSGAALAQDEVPAAALAAESGGRWDEALRLYREVLGREPGRADLWVRVADVEARLGNADAAIAALTAAVDADRQNPELHVRLSQAHAAAGNAGMALRSIEEALAVRPAEPEYLRAGAVLATWAGDHDKAFERYRKLQRLEPENEAILLSLARVSSWSGRTRQAIDTYRRYLGRQPNDTDAWLELAAAESWRGSYVAALGALEEYRGRFGSSRAYTLALARALAGAGRPSRAMEVLEPLWLQDPDNSEVNLARTVALTTRRDIGDAYAALAAVRRVQPESLETKNVERLVRATLGSSVGAGFSVYADSDDLQIATAAPVGSLRLQSGTDLSAGYARSVLQAPRESGLGTTAGDDAVLQRTWGALAQTFSGLTFSGRLGSALADERRVTEYALGARWRASDAFEVEAESGYGFVAISPRTLELGLTEHRSRVDARWTPTISAAIDLDATYSRFSDGNRLWQVRVSPRHAVVRSQWMNLDLGASVYRLEVSRDLSNGYYDPQRYEAYEGTAFPYVKISEDVGLGFSLAAGVQREEAQPFRAGGSASAEATFGIYRAWLLRVSASATHNVRQQSGAFGGYSGSVVLSRRY